MPTKTRKRGDADAFAAFAATQTEAMQSALRIVEGAPLDLYLRGVAEETKSTKGFTRVTILGLKPDRCVFARARARGASSVSRNLFHRPCVGCSFKQLVSIHDQDTFCAALLDSYYFYIHNGGECDARIPLWSDGKAGERLHKLDLSVRIRDKRRERGAVQRLYAPPMAVADYEKVMRAKDRPRPIHSYFQEVLSKAVDVTTFDVGACFLVCESGAHACAEPSFVQTWLRSTLRTARRSLGTAWCARASRSSSFLLARAAKRRFRGASPT